MTSPETGFESLSYQTESLAAVANCLRTLQTKDAMPDPLMQGVQYGFVENIWETGVMKLEAVLALDTAEQAKALADFPSKSVDRAMAFLDNGNVQKAFREQGISLVQLDAVHELLYQIKLRKVSVNGFPPAGDIHLETRPSGETVH